MLSITRRPVGALAAVAAAVVLLSGCASPDASGGDSSADADTPAATTRTVVDVGGEVEIPTSPDRIVALDEVAALNLLSVGIRPDVVFNSWKTTVPLAVLEAEGIEIVGTTEFFPELEKVAATDPDLIVGSINEAYLERYPDYASIAPTVRAVMQKTADGETVAEAYGRYFDREAEAAAVTAVLDDAAAEVAAAQPADPPTLSAIMAFAPESMVLHIDGDSTLAPVIAAAGFAQPESQKVSPEGGSMYGGWTPFSPEKLAEHDGDALVIAVAAQYPLEGITSLPLYSTLNAVQSGRSIVVDGDMWAGGASFFQYWALQDLSSIAAGEDTAGTAADAAARWTTFLESTGN